MHRALIATILLSGTVSAQHCTAPPFHSYGGYYGLPGSPSVVLGPGWGYGLGWGWGPGWGWWNGGVNGSFYSNGLSLYGMPTPAPGGITPGFFGGSDNARIWQNMPPYIGLGWLGSRSPLPNVHGAARDFAQVPLPADYSGPRLATRDVKRHFAAVKAEPVEASNRELADLYRINYGILLIVKLPDENCPLYLQGQPTTSTGCERVFQSPRLPQGSRYKYTVTAKIGDRTETREVTGQPGDSLTVDFTSP